jgi:heme exporter protein D
MNWRDRLNLTVGVAVVALPFVVNLILLLRRKRYLLEQVPMWRYHVAVGGLVLALIASLPTPLFYFDLELPTRMQGEWLPQVAAMSLSGGFIAGLVAIGLMAFGRGMVRWVGIAATLVSVAFLYITLLGLSD